jgi:hypothetical protein
MGGHPAAQHAARVAERGDLGLSMSVSFRTKWLAHPAPNEWPGLLDVCVRDAAIVEAVALTPAPTIRLRLSGRSGESDVHGRDRSASRGTGGGPYRDGLGVLPMTPLWTNANGVSSASRQGSAGVLTGWGGPHRHRHLPTSGTGRRDAVTLPGRSLLLWRSIAQPVLTVCFFRFAQVGA